MFNFFIQNRNKEMQSLAEIIAVDMAKLNLSRLAIEKAMLMIAKAIAKSDILIQTESKDKRRQEYRLNIQPNDHECGTAFWTEVVKQLLTEQEVLIIPLGGKYYRASAWESTTNVLTERTYSHITLTCGGLKNRLNELGYHPTIAHEYVTEDRVWHSYFSITTDGVIG